MTGQPQRLNQKERSKKQLFTLLAYFFATNCPISNGKGSCHKHFFGKVTLTLMERNKQVERGLFPLKAICYNVLVS